MTQEKLVLAIPKGRIAKELVPLLEKAGITPEDAFFDKKSRLLRFTTNLPHIDIIRVRSFDVPTFVAFGAAACGVDFSGAAGGAATVFSEILICAAAWWQWQQQHRALQVVQWRQLQVVQQMIFSVAAGDAAERFQWGCGWCSGSFSDFEVCSCVVVAGV